MTLSIPVAVFRLISDVFATSKPQTDFLNTGHYYSRSFTKSQFRLIGMVGEPAYQVMLTFYTSLITPLFFGSISVSLHIPKFVLVYFMIFGKNNFVMLTSNSLYPETKY